MTRRHEKRIIGAALIVAVFLATSYAFSDVPENVSVHIGVYRKSVPLWMVLAACSSISVAYCLVVDSQLPIGSSAIDMLHKGMRLSRHHLMVRGRRDNYWHLRIAIAVASIITIEVLVDALGVSHGG